MPRIKDTDDYPIKSAPVAEDWIIGNDSENNGATVGFLIGDITGETSTVADNNKGKEVNFGFASAGSNAAVADAINSIAAPVTVLYDEYPVFIGIVPDSVIPAISYRNVYILAGKGKGSYGVGGSVTVLSADLILVSSSQSTFDPVGDDPAAQLENLGEVGTATISATMNVASPAILLEAGTNLYLEVTRSGDRYVYGFTGAPAVYGLGQTQTVDGDFFLIYSEDTIQPTLQSVLSAGGYASTLDGVAYFNLSLIEGSGSSFEWESTSGTSFIGMYSDATVWRMRSANSVGGRESQYRVSGGTLDFYQEVTAGSTTVNFIDPVAITTLRYPAKTVGTYTIATTADITTPSLDAILEADLGTGFSKNSSYIAFDSTFSQILISDGNAVGQNQEFFIGAGDLFLQHTIGTSLSMVNLNLGNLVLSEKNATGQTDVAYTEPIANTTLRFPAKTIGTYTLATIEDYTLQTVLDNSGSATSNDFAGSIDLTIADGGSTAAYFTSTYLTKYSEFYWDATSVRMLTSDSVGGRESQYRVSGGLLDFYQEVTAGSTTVNFIDPVAITTLRFPAKTIGTYTLATLNDIYGWNITDTFGTTTFFADAYNWSVDLDLGTALIKAYDGVAESELTLEPYSVTLKNIPLAGTAYSEISLSSGLLTMREFLTVTEYTNISCIAPTVGTTLKFPAKAVAGTYNLATDKVVSNDVTTTYNFVLADANNIRTLNNAAAVSAVIPANGSIPFPIGTEIPVFNKGAGVVTVSITTDTLNSELALTIPQYGRRTLTKIAATEWILSY